MGDLRKRDLIRVIVIVIFISLGVGSLLYRATKSYLVGQAEEKIEHLLLAHKGIHQYVQEVMHPEFYKAKDTGDITLDYYAPEILSSSFIVRNQHNFYNQERQSRGMPEMYYKMAAKNPRNKLNMASEHEAELIEMFNKNRDLKKHQEIITVGDQNFLYVAIPFLPNTKNCLKCHGARDQAPKQLQTRYAGEGGFNENVGDIRAIISVRTPIEKEYYTTLAVVFACLFGLVLIMLLVLFNKRLSSMVFARTESLKQKEEEVHLLLNSTAEAIYGVDVEGNCTFVNPSCLKILGYGDEQELLGKNMHDLIHHTHADGTPHFVTDCLIYKAYQDKRGTHDETDVLWRKDGTSFPAEYWSYPIFKGDQILGAVVTFVDITERKQAEEALREYAKNQTVLLEEVNHRVKNNLASIVGLIHKEEERLKKANELCQTKSLQDIVGRVKALSTVHTLLSAIKWQPLSITSLCNKIISTVIQGSALGSSITYRVAEAPFVIDAHRAHHLGLVINELIYNTVKHATTDRPLEVSVTFKELGHKLFLTYHDTGIGFPQDVCDGAHSETMGLEIVRGIVKKSLQGEVNFLNDNGAKVEITFTHSEKGGVEFEG